MTYFFPTNQPWGVFTGVPQWGLAQVNGTAPSYSTMLTGWLSQANSEYPWVTTPLTSDSTCLMFFGIGAGGYFIVGGEALGWTQEPPYYYPLGQNDMTGTVKVVNGVGRHGTVTNNTEPYFTPLLIFTPMQFTSQIGTFYIGSEYYTSTTMDVGYQGTNNNATTVTLYPYIFTTFQSATTFSTTLPSATWGFSFAIHIDTISYGMGLGTGYLAVRVWKTIGTITEAGIVTDAVELTTAPIHFTTFDWSVAGQQNVTATWTAPAITLAGEYLLFQVAVVGASTNGHGLATLYQGPWTFITTDNNVLIDGNGITVDAEPGAPLIEISEDIHCTGSTVDAQVGVADNTVEGFFSGVTVDPQVGVGEAHTTPYNLHGVIVSPVTGSMYGTVEGFFSGVTVDAQDGIPTVELTAIGAGSTAHPVTGSAEVPHDCSGATVDPQTGTGEWYPLTQGEVATAVPGVSTVILIPQANGAIVEPVTGTASLMVQTVAPGVGVTVEPVLGVPTIHVSVVLSNTGVNVSPVPGVTDNTVEGFFSGVNAEAEQTGVAYVTVKTQAHGAVVAPTLGTPFLTVEGFIYVSFVTQVWSAQFLTDPVQGSIEVNEAA